MTSAPLELTGEGLMGLAEQAFQSGDGADALPSAALRNSARAAVMLTAAGILTGVGSLVFNVIVARNGGAQAYGAAGVLLALVSIAGFVANGIQYAVARRAALADGVHAELRLASRSRSVLLVVPGLLLLTIALGPYLHLSGPAPTLLTFALLLGTLISAIPVGLFIGLGRFAVLAAVLSASVVVRLVGGVVLTRVMDPVTGSLLASIVPVAAATTLLAILMLRDSDRPALTWNSAASESSTETSRTAGIALEAAGGGLSAGLLWALWALPLLFVRHAATASNSGDFAAAQLLASGIIFVSAPLVMAFYPAIARYRGRMVTAVGLAATVGIGAVGAAALALLGPVLAPHLWGGEFVISRALFLATGCSAATIASATYLLWAARARQRYVVHVQVGIVVALLLEIVLGMFGARNLVEMAVTPMLSAVFGAATVWAAAGRGLSTLLAARWSRQSR